MEESIVTEEVIRNWFTYYGQVFQHVRDMCVLIKSLHDQQGNIESMEKEIQDQLVLEMENLDKLEKQEHQWIDQARPSLVSLDKIHPHMKRLLETIEEKTQLLGPDMSNIFNMNIHQKVENLSSLTTLTIDIQKVLYTWEKFQHQLAINAEAIVEVCIQKKLSIRKHNP